MFSPFGRLYGRIADFRNTLYEKGWIKSFSLGAPTISVGNLTVGGTGKTPLVALVAEILTEAGAKVCILTRGYGRENPKQRVLVSDGETILADVRQAGDEPLELAIRLLSLKTIVVADADRVAAARWVREKFGVTAFVLDDGFQHRRAQRNLDIVCVDATDPFGNGRIVPAGILREPLPNLRRADAVVITRANLIENVSILRSQIAKLGENRPIFTAENKIAALTELRLFLARTQSRAENEQKSENQTSEFENAKLFAFCALGNPENFFAQLRRDDFALVSTAIFPDHHFYAAKDIENLIRKAKSCGAEALVTTAKDAVKLRDLRFEMPCFVAESELRFENEAAFRETISSVLS